LYDLIEEKEMLEILKEENPLEKMIEKANLAGGKDNITGVLLWIES
jgi:serine/threonine protein phosphatase PrpC